MAYVSSSTHELLLLLVSCFSAVGRGGIVIEAYFIPIHYSLYYTSGPNPGFSEVNSLQNAIYVGSAHLNLIKKPTGSKGSRLRCSNLLWILDSRVS